MTAQDAGVTIPAAPVAPIAPASPVAPTAPAAPSAISTAMSSITVGERLLLIGSALLVAGDLLFGVFLDYSFSNTAWMAAVIASVVILVQMRPSMGMTVPTGAYRLGLISLGVVAVLSGVRWLLFDLQALDGRISATYLLGAVVFYAGVALMGFGAFKVWKNRA